MERRLATILAADVVGYSKRMESAEEPTAEAMARQRWARSHNAAAYAGLTPPAPPRIPLRVDLVFVGADGSGNENLELATDDLRCVGVTPSKL